MTVSEAKRFARSSDPSVRAEASRVLAASRARKARVRPKRAGSVAKKVDRKARDAAFYEQAKREAAERATDRLGIRCEGPTSAPAACGTDRCGSAGQDPDHVLGGSMRKECERLGAEGLMVLCRYHHDAKHASSPTRGYWLDIAESHALRHGYRRLLSLVARARAKYEARHPEHRKEADAP